MATDEPVNQLAYPKSLPTTVVPTLPEEAEAREPGCGVARDAAQPHRASPDKAYGFRKMDNPSSIAR